MPRMYDAIGRTDDLTAAMISLLDGHGVGGLSLRATCRASGTSTASALNHYGGWERLRGLGAQLTWEWRQRAIRSRAHLEGLAAFFPVDVEERAEARAWLAWQEIGRTDRAIGELVAKVRDDELATIDRVTEGTLDETSLRIAHATVNGLLAATCARVDPLSTDEATRLLARLVTRLVTAQEAEPQRATQPPT